MRFLLKEPLTVSKGQNIEGNIKMIANKEQSFVFKLKLRIPDVKAEAEGDYDIKNPEFRMSLLNPSDRSVAIRKLQQLLNTNSQNISH